MGAHNSLLFIGLCKEYGLNHIFYDNAILVAIGGALSSALNDGFGIERKPALVNIDGLFIKYNLKEIIPDIRVSELFNRQERQRLAFNRY
jgi:hypothetical protein